MAEGSSFPSFTDGSDVCAENSCTPCGEGNINEEAVKYCHECEEYLCTRCTSQHTWQKATKTHKLVDKKDAKHSLAVVKTKCLYHPDRDIEMFCRKHDMVYCAMCIATDHRVCEQVDKIESKLTSSVNQTEINHISGEIATAKETLISATEKQKHNLASLEEERINIDRTLDDIEEKMIHHIRKLKQEAKQSVTKKYDMMKLGLESEISTSSNMIESLKEGLQHLKSIDSLNPEQQFIHIKLTKKTITNARELNTQTDSKGICSISFTANNALAEFVSSVDSFGLVQEGKQLTKPKQYKLKAMKDINVKLNNDKSACNISDICQLSDGRIVLTDQTNRNVKMLDLNYNVKDSCELDAGPTGICCISSNEVAIKMTNNTVQFVSVESSLSKTRCFSISGGIYYGLTYCDGGLWVSTGGGINIYNTAGTLIKSLDKNHDGNRIFKSSTQHMSVTGDKVIVTDWSDGAVCLNKDGTVMRELRDSRLKNSKGVCVADDGTVFVCGYYSHNVVMFNKDGNCKGELVAANCGLKKPLNMCYNKHKNTLIVITYGSTTLKVLEFEE
ncbi:uncharacterized protein LOC132753213 [Ruditapes philippinarum]|uniref:uncharacterized protein LOC132753213 n=1 Tax=Ruditapes philippinarum TaxID=129788 RepID=UPI00295A59FB|nr:uncharacterized protein LOC132753213 [Ruditapes philippinarum]